MVEKDGESKAGDFEFKQSTKDDKRLCQEWIDLIASGENMGRLIMMTVGLINIGVETIIGFGSEYITRPRNY